MIFIGLGSNEGNPARNVLLALTLLEKKGVGVLRRSALYLTEPWGIREQNAFVNAVAELAFEGSAEDLLDILLAIEEEMGRIRRFKWGPRLIDLDIVEFHGQQIQNDRLDVPHMFYLERDFVLVPLAELEPEWLPTGKTDPISKYLDDLGDIKMERLPEK